MSFQFIFREDAKDFQVEDLIVAFGSIEAISNIKQNVRDSLMEALFSDENGMIVIEVRQGGGVISNFTSSIDFIAFGLQLQQKLPYSMRLTDDGLNYDLDLSKYDTVDEVINRSLEEDPYDDYSGISPWSD